MKTVSRVLAVLLALLTALPLAGCARLSRTVCTVGDFEVSYELYRYAALELRQEYDGGDSTYWEGEIGLERTDELKGAVESLLRQYAAVMTLCDRYGVSIEDEYVKKQVDDALVSSRTEYGGKSAFRDQLKAAFMTEAVWEFLEGASVCQDELFYAMVKAGAVTESEEALKAFFDSDRLIRVKQILIDPARYASDKEALSVAKAVRALALAGQDFDTLVTQYGNDLFMFKNTDGYYMMRGTRFEAFEDAAFALKIGEISEIVKTPAGYSVILRLNKDPSYIADHFDDLSDDYADAKFGLAIEDLAASLTVTYLETPDLLQLTMD